MTGTLALGASAWGVYTALAGPPETPPPAAGAPSGEDLETAEPPVELVELPSVVTGAAQNGTGTPDGPEPPAGGADPPPPVTFEEDAVYDQRDAQGFIKLNALRLRLLHKQKR